VRAGDLRARSIALRNRILVGGYGLVDLLLGDGSRHYALQETIASEVVFGILDLRRRTRFRGKRLLILRPRLQPLRLDLGEARSRIGGIDLDEQLSLLHELIVVDGDLDHLSSDLWRHIDDMRVDKGVVCVLILAGIKPPDEATDEHQSNDSTGTDLDKSVLKYAWLRVSSFFRAVVVACVAFASVLGILIPAETGRLACVASDFPGAFAYV
jgi:hypothetical protein